MSKRSYLKPTRRFTDEEKAFLLNNYSFLSLEELAAALVLSSGTPWTASQVKQLLERMGQKRGKKQEG